MKESMSNGGIIGYEYDNEEIYRNKRRMRICYKVALIFAVIVIITAIIDVIRCYISGVAFTVIPYLVFDVVHNIGTLLLFCLEFFGIVLSAPCLLLRDAKENEKKLPKYAIKGSPSLVSSVIVLPLFVVAKFGLCFPIANYNFTLAVELFYYDSLTYIPLVVAWAFSIRNCVIMKREWKTSPPQSVREAQIKAERQKNGTEAKKLLEQCGMKFFIKYYKQIKFLPMRDVVITEVYAIDEKRERMLAAKKIIDSNLSEFAFNEILNNYGVFLDENELELVKALLSETQKKEEGELKEKIQ